MPIFFKVNSHKHPIRQRQLFNLIFVTKTKIKDKAVKRKDLILVAFTNKKEGEPQMEREDFVGTKVKT